MARDSSLDCQVKGYPLCFKPLSHELLLFSFPPLSWHWTRQWTAHPHSSFPCHSWFCTFCSRQCLLNSFMAQEVQHIEPFLTEKPFPTLDHPLGWVRKAHCHSQHLSLSSLNCDDCPDEHDEHLSNLLIPRYQSDRKRKTPRRAQDAGGADPHLRPGSDALGPTRLSRALECERMSSWQWWYLQSVVPHTFTLLPTRSDEFASWDIPWRLMGRAPPDSGAAPAAACCSSGCL